ncbi:MAG: hypothetical protein WAN43_00600 [Rhodomicrobium sp.]
MKHIIVQPTDSVDFVRQELDASGVWFRNPQPQWLPNLMPEVLGIASRGTDFTFSTFRKFGFLNPDFISIPAGSNFRVQVFMPLGRRFGEGIWGAVSYFAAGQPPVAHGERFSLSDGGLRRQLDRLFQHSAIDPLRDLDKRPRYEIWVRHNWDASVIAPGLFDLPGWARGIDPDDPRAADKLRALRAPMSGADYLELRARERAAREREAALADDVPQPPAATEEQALPPDAFRYVGDEPDIRLHEHAPHPSASASEASDAPDAPDAPAAPVDPLQEMSREELVEAKKRKARIARATQGKVAADKFNADAAKAHAEKVVRRLEHEGQL